MPTAPEPSPQMPGVFVAMDPPDHTRLRRMLTGAFTVKRVKQLEKHITDIAERQLDELARFTPPVVVVSLLAANHDPKRFDNPDTLDIQRKARGHLSFGHGIHQCLGQQLARIEMRAGFAGLLRRFPTLSLAIPAGEVELKSDVNIYGVHELPVTSAETRH